MINSTVNFTTFEEHTNSTTPFLGPVNILDILNIVFGLPTHSYIIWLIVTGTGSGVASEFFILNLSICELSSCVNCLLSLFEVWTACIVIRMLADFFIGLGITGRSLFQCLISVERYLAVVHPVTFLKYKPLRYRVICCTVAWMITLSSCLCCLFTVGSFDIYVWFFSVQYLLFFSIQLFCCLAVLRALKQSGPGGRAREREEENHMKRRAFHLILITTVSMAIIFVPFIITGMCYIFGNKFFPDHFTLELYCFVLAGFVQPVLYLNRVGKLRCLCFR